MTTRWIVWKTWKTRRRTLPPPPRHPPFDERASSAPVAATPSRSEMPLPEVPSVLQTVPSYLVTRFARGRLGCWLVLSATTALLYRPMLVELPRWVFTIWALWILISTCIVIGLEYVFAPVRRPWVDALQACIDFPVIALVTWYNGTAPFLMVACFMLPMASAVGWLPRRQAIYVTIVGQCVLLSVFGVILSGTDVPPPLGTNFLFTAPRSFLIMAFAVQSVILPTISWLQYMAVRSARDRRDRWQRLFDGAPDSIFVLDRNANVLRMNAAARQSPGTIHRSRRPRTDGESSESCPRWRKYPLRGAQHSRRWI
jgi:PAS domain-containing protein